MKTVPSLEAAMISILDKIDGILVANQYNGPQIEMFITGEAAEEFIDGYPPAQRLNAWFSRRMTMNYLDLIEMVERKSGNISMLYFNAGYNPNTDNHVPECPLTIEWDTVNNRYRHITAFVVL